MSKAERPLDADVEMSSRRNAEKMPYREICSRLYCAPVKSALYAIAAVNVDKRGVRFQQTVCVRAGTLAYLAIDS